MSLNVVLYQPLIPGNAGTIGRLTAATNTRLHFVKPLGFELSDRYLKRAGLDYWPEVQLTVHESWDDFLRTTGAADERMWFFTSYASKSYATVEYNLEDYLIFGNETVGFPPEMHERYGHRRLLIPMENPNVRSLNLSNCASIVLYEARRQNGIGV